MHQTDVNTKDATRTTKSRKTLMVGVMLLGMAAMIGGLLWARDKSAGMPDLLGTQRALPPGALHVEDVAADMKGYKGTVLVRGVMAVASANDPTIFAMIDSREARVCNDLYCAKRYLPVKTSGAIPKPWEELNVQGSILSNGKMTYLQAESVENLGSIK